LPDSVAEHLKGSAPVAKSSSKKSASSKSTPKKKAVKRPAPAAKKPAAPVAKKLAAKPAAKKAAAAKTIAIKPVAKSAAAPTRPVLPAKAARPTPGKVSMPGSGSTQIHTRPERSRNAVGGAALPPPFASGEVVLSNGKPKKNQAGLNMRELEHFRDLLLAKRRELVGDMSSMEREALRSTSGSNLSNLPIHMADMGTDNYEQEFTLGLVQKDRDILREINLALAKIQNGTFGICEGTGKPIGKPRLEAKPWARHGIEYARKLESHGVRR
jgi:RNA polymerase-binding protein DksA